MLRQATHIQVFAVSPVDTFPVDTLELLLLELFPEEFVPLPPGIVGITDEAGVVLAVTVVVGVTDAVGVVDGDVAGVVVTVGVDPVGVIFGVVDFVGVGVVILEGWSGSSTENPGILSLIFEFSRKVALTFS